MINCNGGGVDIRSLLLFKRLSIRLEESGLLRLIAWADVTPGAMPDVSTRGGDPLASSPLSHRSISAYGHQLKPVLV